MTNEAINALAQILWTRWMEMLPNSPWYMSEKILQDLLKQGWELRNANTGGTDHLKRNMERREGE